MTRFPIDGTGRLSSEREHPIAALPSSVVTAGPTFRVVSTPLEFVSGVAFTPDGSKFYAADYQSGSAAVLNPTTRSLTKIIGLPHFNNDFVRVTPDGLKVYFDCFSVIAVVDTTTDSLLTSINIPSADGTYGLGISPNGTKAYVSIMGLFNGANGTATVSKLAALDIATDVLGTPAVIPGPLWGPNSPAVFNLAGTKAYIAMSGNSTVLGANTAGTNGVIRINVATDVVEASLVLGGGSTAISMTGIAITPNGTKLYACDGGESKLYVIDVASFTLVDTLQLTHGPGDITIGPDGIAYITESDGTAASMQINRVDTATDAILDPLTIGGKGPVHLAVSPDDTQMWGGVRATGTIAMFTL